MSDEEQRDDLDLAGGSAAAEDPLAGVPSEPIQDVSEADESERLGGTGAEIGQEAAPPPGEFMEEPEEDERDEQEELAEEPPAAAEEPEAPEETPAAEEPPPAQAEEPQAAPPAEPEPKSSSKKGAKSKAKTEPRKYQVLRLDGGGIDSPFSGPIEARNGDDAIKLAYKELAKSSEESMEFVAVPFGYWNPKKVKGRKKEDFAVEVN